MSRKLNFKKSNQKSKIKNQKNLRSAGFFWPPRVGGEIFSDCIPPNSTSNTKSHLSHGIEDPTDTKETYNYNLCKYTIYLCFFKICLYSIQDWSFVGPLLSCDVYRIYRLRVLNCPLPRIQKNLPVLKNFLTSVQKAMSKIVFF